jgi:hypothetical protein
MTRFSARLLALTVAAGLLLTPVAAQAAPARPKATSPGVTANVTSMPILTWKKAARAKTYEVQIASDAGFNPAMNDVTTGNIRYVHTKVLPNGAYFWRLRSLDATGGASKWTPVRKFTKTWAALATLATPANLGVISYPSPVILRWSQVSGASTYLVSVAAGAPGGGVDAPGGVISSGALAINDSGKPISTSNTNFAISAALHSGTYYWQITPVDAEGHAGKPSAISSFVWTWNGATTPAVTDMVAGQEIFDPLFSWAPIPGAASYQVEVNIASGFAPGSRMLLADTYATSFAPTRTMPNNTYYWRIRGVDAQGQAGPWNNGPIFDKTYDQTVPQGPQDLHVEDTTGLRIVPSAAVNEPVVRWNTVPGARHYEVDLSCSGSGSGHYETANTAWTPFAQLLPGDFPNRFHAPGIGLGTGTPPAGNCTATVRAVADDAIDSSSIFGPSASVAFTVGGQGSFSNPAVDCTPSVPSCVGRMTAANVRSPGSGTSVNKSPLICWKPADFDATASAVTPSDGYWVAIARDPNFSTIVQWAYTTETCFAPRSPLVDEATLYYWQVIPTLSTNPPTYYDPTAGNEGGFFSPPSFQHASTPPTPVSPVGGASASGPVVFHWNPVPEQVRNYTIEVAQDDSFSTILESATTDATAYSATTTYPVGATVFWRVRANNDDAKGLAWSATSSFVQTLPIPTITTTDAFSGETFPALTWNPVPGAVSYEVQDVWPDASVHLTSNIPSTAVSYTKMTGTGHGTVQVRAVFPGNFKSAYTPTRDVVHTIGEPQGAHTLFTKKSGALTLVWKAKPNAKQYKVQIGRGTSFLTTVVDDTTDEPLYTPLLTQQDFTDGGLLYWRVAAIDPDGNVGGYSRPVKLTLLARMNLTAGGPPARKTRGLFTVTVTMPNGKPLKAAKVRIAGAGISSITRITNKKGIATFTIKPLKKGSIGIRGTKNKYRTALLTVPIT